MGKMWIDEDWHPALQCACQSVRWSLQVGISLPEIVGWFYDDATLPGTDDWDDCVLRARWETHAWRSVFEMWDECGRPDFDPSVWGGAGLVVSVEPGSIPGPRAVCNGDCRT